MSGTGKKQRTKGNVKPSSSARAAELLSAAGHGIPNTVGFMGFDAIPINADYEGSSSFNVVDEPEDLDEDFRTSFRKAMKKDFVTKTKALREIASLIPEKDEKNVGIAWQCWPRLYAKLALDGNFKVRELAHLALGAFAQKLNRQITNQLKNVAPYWLMGEHDPYQAAAQAAKQTFQDAFPAGKRPQVLAFCKEAIISQCAGFVFSIDEQSGANSSIGDTEESSETRAVRLSSCSINALNTFVSAISQDELKSAQDTFSQSLLSNTKFWKMGDKVKPTAVRVAWFNFISCLIRRCPALLSEKANKLVPLIINALDESEAPVVGPIWDCLSNYLTMNSEEFWQICNLRKAFLPKLVSITRKAFNGCASVIGEGVCGAIKHLPIGDDTADIYDKLVLAFHDGCTFITDSKTTATEISSFTRIYCDFIKTICSNYTAVPQYLTGFLTDADKAFVIVASYLRYPSPLLVKESLCHLAELATFIIDQLPLKESNLITASSVYQDNLHALLSSSLPMETNASIESLSTFMAALANRSTKLLINCASISYDYWKLYESNGQDYYLNIFRNVFCGIQNIPEFVQALEPGNDSATSVEKFMSELLLQIAKIDGAKDVDSNIMGWLLDCCFTLFPILNSGQKTEMMKKLCQVKQIKNQYELLQKLRQAKNETLFEYVPKSEFSNLFMECFKSISSFLSTGTASDDQRKQWRLLSEYLAGNSTTGTLVSTSMVISALEYLTTTLVGIDNNQNLSFIVSLIGQLTSEIIFTHKAILNEKSGTALVIQLFDLFCTHSEEMTEDALNWTKKAWTSALAVFCKTLNKQSISDLASGHRLYFSLPERLVSHVQKAALNIKKLDWLSSVGMNIFVTCYEAFSNWDEAERMEVFNVTLAHLVLINQLLLMVSKNEVKHMGWIMNAIVSGRFPVMDLTFLKANLTDATNLINGDGEEFMNLAAYALRFGHRLNTESSIKDVFTSTTFNYLVSIHGSITTGGFSALSYLHHTTELFSICNLHENLVSLKTFGIWLSSTAIEFWNSLDTKERHEVSQNSWEKSMIWGTLATQAIEFLQYDLREEDVAIENLECNDHQEVAEYCLAPLLWKDSFSVILPNLESLDKVIGYLHLAAFCEGMTNKLVAFDWLMSIKQEFLDEKMLFSCTVNEASDDVMMLNMALMRYFSQVVSGLPELSNEQRDFMLCATLTWLQSCAESDLSNDRVQLFAIFAIQLFCNVSKFMESIKDDANSDAIMEEWIGFFLKGCIQIIVPLYFKLASQQTLSALCQHYLLREISAAVHYARYEDLMEVDLPPLLSPDLDSLGYPEKLQTILLHACPCLDSTCVPVQVASFSILEKFIGQLYEYESKNVKESDEGETRELPSYFVNLINHSYEHIENEFDDLQHLEDKPLFMTYFLTWKLLLRFFATLKTDERPAFSTALTSSRMLDKLMLTLLAVLPENVASSGKNKRKDGETDFEKKVFEYAKTFEEAELKSVIDVSDVNSSFLQAAVYSQDQSTTCYGQEYSCHIFFETLRLFPAAIRQWYNGQEKKVANVIERFATKYVSLLLCGTELQAITKGEKKYENMTLMARPAAREVVARYKLEDLTMELVVTLPPNYPLSPATVDVNHRVGVTVEQWRKWMLQLTVFLSHQNGGLLDGMLLWKGCIDKHLQGVEDCMICMMAVHGSNYQLPKITCKKCKKKFHAACLYKWFNTSSNTSCPLCRTTF